MPQNLTGRSNLKLLDFTADEVRYRQSLAAGFKVAKAAGTECPRLTGKTIALIFEKASTRTGSAFEVAADDQGARVSCIGPAGSHNGHRDTIKAAAPVLGRCYDVIEHRGFKQSDAEMLAVWSSVPVCNGLADPFRPTQALADLLAMTEFTHKHLSDNRDTELGEEIFAKYGIERMGVTDEVFESRASVVFDQAENRLHTIKAVFMATLEG